MFNNEVFIVHQKSSQTKLSRISANLRDICIINLTSFMAPSSFEGQDHPLADSMEINIGFISQRSGSGDDPVPYVLGPNPSIKKSQN